MRKKRKPMTYEGSTADKVIGYLEANPRIKSLTTHQIADMFITAHPPQVAGRLKSVLWQGLLVRHGVPFNYSYSLPEKA